MNSSLGVLRQAAIANGLQQCGLFAGCKSDVLDQIASISSVRRLKTGEYLFQEHTPVWGFFIVQQGAIHLHRAVTHAREHTIHVFRPGESLGEETLVSELGYSAAARATEPSQVFVVQKAGFLALLQSQPELSLRLLGAMSRQFNMLVRRLDELMMKDVPTRVADWLLDHCDDPSSSQPQAIRVPETKRMLAAELGTCSETLSRTLAKLRKQRLLLVSGRTVTVLSPSRLARQFRSGEEPVLSPPACRCSTRLPPLGPGAAFHSRPSPALARANV